jgi:hypothetical protein
MTPTSVELPDRLKQRAAEAANDRAFRRTLMVQAIAQTTAQAEQRGTLLPKRPLPVSTCWPAAKATRPPRCMPPLYAAGRGESERT